MTKNNNNKKGLFTRVVALYIRFLTTIPLPPVSMFKAQSISPADRGAYCEHALKAGRSKCNIFVADRPGRCECAGSDCVQSEHLFFFHFLFEQSFRAI